MSNRCNNWGQYDNHREREAAMYGILAKELGMIYKSKTCIVPYVVTWDGLVTKFYKQYCRCLKSQPKQRLTSKQSLLRRHLKLISLDRRRGIEDKELEVGKSVECINTTYFNVLKRYIKIKQKSTYK